MSDIILPHLGGSFNDHLKKCKIFFYLEKLHYLSNIRNASYFLMARIREEMEKEVGHYMLND
jgi:hypothetical protein